MSMKSQSILNNVGLILDVFKRAINGTYPAPLHFVADLRRNIMDYEGTADERNCKIDTSHMSLYMSKSLIDADLSLCLAVTDNIYEANVYPNMCIEYFDRFTEYDHLVVISPLSMATPDDTAKTIFTLYRYFYIIESNVFEDMYNYIDVLSVIHVIVNFMYKEYNLDLTRPDNFKAGFIDVGLFDVYDSIEEFFAEDFKIVDPIHVDFPSLSKLSGTYNRWEKFVQNKLKKEAKDDGGNESEEKED